MITKTKTGMVTSHPCGQCKACRINKAREWSVRIMNETEYYEDNCFLTLTYDDEHLPANKSLDKKALSKFLNKAWPYAYGRHSRYYASGEYGSEEFTSRPHYHIILFGVSPTDKIFLNKRYDKKHGGWHCDLKCWPFGKCFTAPVTYDDACYVASYTMKKLTGKKGEEYYKSKGIMPEFSVMSLKPGIGAKYMRDHKGKLYRRGYIVGKKGIKYPIPRYYKDKTFSIIHRDFMREMKQREFNDEIAAKASKSAKEFWRYKEELLENAKNLVDAFISMKGKKNEI